MRGLVVIGALALMLHPCAVLANGPGSAAPPKIAIERFSALSVFEMPNLSPDGRRIAALSGSGASQMINIVDADRPDALPRRIPVGRTALKSLKWAGNERLLATVEFLAQMYNSTIPFFRLVSIDLRTGETRLVDSRSVGIRAGDVLYTDPTGAWALVASEDEIGAFPSVKRVDLASGKAQTVEKEREGVWDWYADNHGVVRAGVGYRDSKWTIWYRDQPQEPLRMVRGSVEAGKDSAIDRFIFRGANNWVVTNERTGRFGLYKYNVTTGAIGEPLFEDPQVDLEDVVYDGITGTISAVKFETDRPRIAWLDPDMKVLQAKLDRALPSTVNITVDWSDDHKRALVRAESASDPGTYYILDRSTSQMHPVAIRYPSIDPGELAEVKAVRYPARDGLTLPAYLTLPRGREAKALPLIVMPHGGPYARDHWEYDPMVQFLANRGYAVLQPQFRGSTGYGRDFVQKATGEWGRKMQDDLDDGVDWLVRTGQVDAH